MLKGSTSIHYVDMFRQNVMFNITGSNTRYQWTTKNKNNCKDNTTQSFVTVESDMAKYSLQQNLLQFPEKSIFKKCIAKLI